MGVNARILLALAGLVSAPTAMASDPVHDPFCPDAELCVGPGTCTPVACVPRGCAPVLSCRTHIEPDRTTCVVNTTIEGRTCAIHVGAEARVGSLATVGAGVQATDGEARANELQNTWVSPGVEGYGSAAGMELGHYYASAYRSDIQTQGPRSGPYGILAPSQNQTWTEVGVAGGFHGGPLPDQLLYVGVELLDFMPEGCFFRSASPLVPDVECPSLAPFYPARVLP